MRAPAEKRSIDEIVGEVVQELGVGYAIRPAVQKLISAQSSLRDKPPAGGYETENSDYLKKLCKQIVALKATIEAAPNDVLFVTLFVPKLQIPPPGTASVVVAAIDDATQDAGAQCWDLIRMLEALRVRCEAVMGARPGKHKSAGHRQFRAALGARMLMLMAGKRPTNSSPKSKFRVLAGLFYEAATGTANLDMERACKEALRFPIRIRTENAQSF